MEEFEKMAASELDETEIAGPEPTGIEATNSRSHCRFQPGSEHRNEYRIQRNRRETQDKPRRIPHKPLPMRQPATRSEQKVTGFSDDSQKENRSRPQPRPSPRPKTKKADAASKKACGSKQSSWP